MAWQFFDLFSPSVVCMLQDLDLPLRNELSLNT